MKLYKLIPILFALIYKYSISYSSYSGEATPPLFGDFEAQRHWMEITFHLPIQSWYSYDLEYWGLDYPPLTAYHSLVFGIIGNWIEKSWFALDISRGIEDAGLKIYMRITSIVTDFAILVPAIYLYRKGKMDKFTLLLLVIPGVALIDHGHFQYNSAMLGFSLLSFHYILEEHFMIGSFFFVCSLLFKQMALFYSLPVFIYLLSKSMADFKFNGFFKLCKISFTVISTFTIGLFPFIYHETISQVFFRVFPVGRGLYEDKVANFWCTFSMIVKIRSILSMASLAKLSAIITLLACSPSLINLYRKPQRAKFIQSLSVCSLSFFVFGFQVHEKSILIPLLAITLMYDEQRQFVAWFNNVALFSLWPLFKKDGLHIPYIASLILWNSLSIDGIPSQGDGSPNTSPTPSRKSARVAKNIKMASPSIQIEYSKSIEYASYAIMMILHFLEYTVKPPARLPDIHVVLNQAYSAVLFIGSLVYLNLIQRAEKLKIE